MADQLQYGNDTRVTGYDPLIAPSLLMHELPVSDKGKETIARGRFDVSRVVTGKDDRLLVVVGPCSIHDPEQAKEYARRLHEASQSRWKDGLVVVMRAYFEKPRTTVGWKGLINDPDLNGSFDINRGLRVARKLLIEITDLGMPVACEVLDTISPQYLSDLYSWGAFMGVTSQGLAAIVKTSGNSDLHIIHRGGNKGTNYDPESIQTSKENLLKALPDRHPSIMVDASHGNSSKDYRNQPKGATSVAEQIEQGQDAITGVMLESNLKEGKQSEPKNGKTKDDLEYGVSITDGCIGWDTTVELLDRLNAAVLARRSSRS